MITLIDWLINPLPFECFFGIKGYVTLDINPGLGYNILLLLLIPGVRVPIDSST